MGQKWARSGPVRNWNLNQMSTESKPKINWKRVNKLTGSRQEMSGKWIRNGTENSGSGSYPFRLVQNLKNWFC